MQNSVEWCNLLVIKLNEVPPFLVEFDQIFFTKQSEASITEWPEGSAVCVFASRRKKEPMVRFASKYAKLFRIVASWMSSKIGLTKFGEIIHLHTLFPERDNCRHFTTEHRKLLVCAHNTNGLA